MLPTLSSAVQVLWKYTFTQHHRHLHCMPWHSVCCVMHLATHEMYSMNLIQLTPILRRLRRAASMR